MADCTFGFDELEKKLLNILTVQYPEEIQKKLKQIALSAQTSIAYNTPVDTGNLKRSWTISEPKHINGEWTIEVGSNLEYAPHLEYGHKTPSGGFVQGYHMVEISVKQLEQQLPSDLKDWLQSLMRELSL